MQGLHFARLQGQLLQQAVKETQVPECELDDRQAERL